MTDLQKQIEELEKVANPEKYPYEHLAESGMFERQIAKQALSIIEQLQEENNAYILCLKRINSCDDSATQQSRDAHKVLKQFGKL